MHMVSQAAHLHRLFIRQLGIVCAKTRQYPLLCLPPHHDVSIRLCLYHRFGVRHERHFGNLIIETALHARMSYNQADDVVGEQSS